MTRHFEQFLQERQILKNITPSTLRAYHSAWKAAGPAMPATVEEITPDVLKSIVLHMRSAGLSPISVNDHLRCLNAFLRWLHLEGACPMLWRVPKLKEERKVIQAFTPGDVQALLHCKPRGVNQTRAWVAANVVLDCGPRISELLCLERQDIDLQNCLLKLYGKGRKERIIPISVELRKVLWRWLSTHEHRKAFPTKSGAAVSYRDITRDLAALCAKVGIRNVRTSFHTLRHTFALNYIRNGGDVFRLQRMLGHLTLEMTRRYVNLQTEDLKAVHDRLSLLSR